MLLNVLTNSELATFRTCPRLHHLRYQKLIRPVRESVALKVGTIFHKAVELWMNGTPSDEAITQAVGSEPITYNIAMVSALTAGYFHHWEQAHPPEVTVTEVVALERQFEFRLKDPATNRAKYGVRIAGKIDAIVRLNDGQLAVMEHKTTSDNLAPDSDYWTRLRLDSQIGIYVLGAKSLGYDVTTILYDVASKPGIKPLRATPIENRKFTKDGKLYAAQRENDESVAEYMERCVLAIQADSAATYARRQIARLGSDLHAIQREIEQQISVMHAMGKQSVAPYRNPGSCMMFGRCSYFDMCINNDIGDNGLPDGFAITNTKHGELK